MENKSTDEIEVTEEAAPVNPEEALAPQSFASIWGDRSSAPSADRSFSLSVSAPSRTESMERWNEDQRHIEVLRDGKWVSKEPAPAAGIHPSAFARSGR